MPTSVEWILRAAGKKRPGVRLVSHCHLMPSLRNGELWSLPPITTGCHGLLLNQWSSTYSKTIHPRCVYCGAPVVTVDTNSLTLSSSTFCPHSLFMCFVWISEQTAIISLYNINWLVCVTETECVYCAVRTVALCICTAQWSL